MHIIFVGSTIIRKTAAAFIIHSTSHACQSCDVCRRPHSIFYPTTLHQSGWPTNWPIVVMVIVTSRQTILNTDYRWTTITTTVMVTDLRTTARLSITPCTTITIIITFIIPIIIIRSITTTQYITIVGSTDIKATTTTVIRETISVGLCPRTRRCRKLSCRRLRNIIHDTVASPVQTRYSSTAPIQLLWPTFWWRCNDRWTIKRRKTLCNRKFVHPITIHLAAAVECNRNVGRHYSLCSKTVGSRLPPNLGSTHH